MFLNILSEHVDRLSGSRAGAAKNLSEKLSTRGPRNATELRDRVRAETRRSLRRYRAEPVVDGRLAEALLARACAGTKLRGASVTKLRRASTLGETLAEMTAQARTVSHRKSWDRSWVLVYANRVYVEERFWNRSKHPGHATMLKDAADLVGLPNALYLLTTETTGPNDGCSDNGGPLELTINKQLGYDQCGILVPNTYFGDNHGNLTAWAKENKDARRGSVPFEERRPVALRVRRADIYGGGAARSPRSLGDAAVSTWIVRGDGSRRRRGLYLDSPRARVAAMPRSLLA